MQSPVWIFLPPQESPKGVVGRAQIWAGLGEWVNSYSQRSALHFGQMVKFGQNCAVALGSARLRKRFAQHQRIQRRAVGHFEIAAALADLRITQ